MSELAQALRFAHALRSDEGQVQSTHVVVSKAADRLPQLVLRGSAKDLGRLTLSTTGVMKEQPPAPRAVIGAAYAKLKRDELIGEAEGGKLVNHGLTVVEHYWPVGLRRHQ